METGDIRHLAAHGHEVVGHVAVQQLAVGAVQALFEERRADSLHHAAADLLVDQHRVDQRARVLDTPVLEQLDESRIGIDLDQRRLYSIGEGEAVLARRVMPRHGELGLEIEGQRVGAEVGDASELCERQFLFFGQKSNDKVFLDVDRKSTRLNSSHQIISYAVFSLKKKTTYVTL